MRVLASAATAAALVGTVAACGGGAADAAKDCEFAIGSMGALTGDNAGLGTVMRDGAKTAVELYNKENPDAKVCLVEADSEGTETKAPGVAKNLAKQENVLGVVGPGFSGESHAALPIFEEAGLPIISGSATDPSLSEKGWKTFHRTLGNDATQGPAAAAYIKDVLDPKSVFVIDDNSPYGKGLADEVRKALGDVVKGDAQVEAKQTDFGAVVTAVASEKPDVVFFGGYYAEGGPLADQLKKGGVEATFVGADGLKDENFITAAGDAAEGVILTCPCIPGEQAEGDFAAQFEEIIGEAPGTYGAEAFDAANVFLDGIKDGVKTREAMLEYIKSYDKPGASKNVKFTETGESQDVVVWAYKVENGVIVPAQQIELGS